MAENQRYDEDQEISVLASWVIITLFSASIMLFGWIVYLVVPDAPRHWNFGQLPDTPADYIYSTREPQAPMKPQRQIWMLPEAAPNNPVPAERRVRGD